MDIERATALIDTVMDKLLGPEESGPYAGVLNVCYSFKRKFPNIAGRKQLQWCAVRRSELTEAEIHHLVKAYFGKGDINHAYGLIEERGLIPDGITCDDGIYGERLQRLMAKA